MSDIVDLVHPAIHRFRLRRSRVTRVGIGLVTTPVRIPEAGARRFRRMRDAPGGTTFLAHEGGVWCATSVESLASLPWVVGNGLPSKADTSGRMWGRSGMSLFRRSPLAAANVFGSCDVEDYPGDARPHELVSDGTEQARADLRTWIEGNLRLRDGGIVVRLRGPMGALDDDAALGFAEDAWAKAAAGRAAAPVRAEAVQAFRAAIYPDNPRLRWAVPPAGFDGFGQKGSDDDLLHAVNAAGEEIYRSARLLIANAEPRGAVHDEATGLLEAAYPLMARGILGGIDGADAVAAAEGLARLAADAERLWQVRNGWARDQMRTLAGHLREIVLPGFERAVSPEDEEALGGLAPGR